MHLFQGGRRIVVVLLADRFVGQCVLIPVHLHLDGRQIGLSTAEGSLGIVERRLKRGGINLVELLPPFDIGSLRKQALLNEAVDLGPDFRDAKGRRATG